MKIVLLESYISVTNFIFIAKFSMFLLTRALPPPPWHAQSATVSVPHPLGARSVCHQRNRPSRQFCLSFTSVLDMPHVSSRRLSCQFCLSLTSVQAVPHSSVLAAFTSNSDVTHVKSDSDIVSSKPDSVSSYCKYSFTSVWTVTDVSSERSSVSFSRHSCQLAPSGRITMAVW